MLLLFIPCSISAQWIRTNGIHGGYSITAIGDTFFTGTENIYRSTDNCNTWTETFADSTSIRPFTGFAVNGNTIFAGRGYDIGTGIYRSTDYGASWTPVDTTLMNRSIGMLLAHNGTVYAGTTKGLYRSSDNGDNWLPTSQKNAIRSCVIKDSVILVGGYENGIWRSTDNGATWAYFCDGLHTSTVVHGVYRIPSVNCLAVQEEYVFAGLSDHGIYRSTINGSRWTKVLSINRVNTFAVQGDMIIAGIVGIVQSERGQIVHSTDNGDTWENTLPMSSEVKGVYDLCIESDTAYAATKNGIWYRPLSELRTATHTRVARATEKISRCVIRSPSPADKYVQISFTLTHSESVTITLFNLAGNSKKTQVNGIYSSGTHTLRLAMHSMAAGMYFITVRTGNAHYRKHVPVVW